jgi:hypothetical protein
MSLREKICFDSDVLPDRPFNWECEDPSKSEYFEYDESAPPQLCMVRKAIKLCGTCKKQTRCLEEAVLHNYEDGIWGGKTPSQRRELVEQDEFYANLSKSDSLAQLTEIYKGKYGTVKCRLRRQPEMSIRQAVCTENMQKKPITIGDVTYATTTEAANAVDMTRYALNWRLKSGVDPHAPKTCAIKPRPVSAGDDQTFGSIAEAADYYGLEYNCARSRANNGLDLATKPEGQIRPVKCHDKTYPSKRNASQVTGVPISTVSLWVNNGINGWGYYEPK